ncbi:GDSL-type esterase/lipase family protein [Variovorax dokdonensis]|uniref:GDSL-type esterase/lipase family protein n=1 Tax=Variovorax dokdonensis TaxID=344883 RepID=A0ABT7N6D1_9BURK|nr:GDSL-type esterase/lipase family protein [Variovorax dokdonensis]MDM0043497.1 GDSL-type esterase/lipase family protein [Variovorax dokdonensis]
MRIPGGPWLLLGLALVVVAGAAWYMLLDGPGPAPEVLSAGRPPKALPIAVMGDSDSHSYQDRLSFPPGTDSRGGPLRERTFSWLEILARLRADEVDPGPWLEWGTSGIKSSVRRRLGLPVGRIPRKEDYLYNFANSGAACDDLMTGPFRQAPWLAELMGKEPQRWQGGIVVIRIGLNDWMKLLGVQAENPDAAEVNAAISRCATRYEEAMALLRQHVPGLRFLLVGIANEVDDPGQFDRFQSAPETRNIRMALDRFNGAIRALAERTPGAAYFDVDGWFQRLWGARSEDGVPRYRTVTVGGEFEVNNTAGDDPHNALLADHHAGTVWSALIVQAMVQRLRDAFGVALTPIADDELWRFLQPLVRPQRVRAPGS